MVHAHKFQEIGGYSSEVNCRRQASMLKAAFIILIKELGEPDGKTSLR
jgi:hypothetical protein